MPYTIQSYDTQPPLEISDDDLETGMIGHSTTRSEVTVLIRQIRLRKLTSKARAELYASRKDPSRTFQDKEEAACRLNDELERWRASSTLVAYPMNSYESIEYLEINFHRER